jgi:hypothetical protein
MPLPIIAPLVLAWNVGSRALEIWGLIRLAQARGSPTKAHEILAKDWETIGAIGQQALSIARVIAGLDGLEAGLSDGEFAQFVKTIAWSRRALGHLPLSVRNIITAHTQFDQKLDVEARYAYMQHVIRHANSVQGSTSVRIRAQYEALYVIGRTNVPVRVELLETIRQRLVRLHSKRQYVDARLKETLAQLDSSEAPTLMSHVQMYNPLFEGRGEKKRPAFHPNQAEYIVNALLPLSRGTLDNREIVAELVERYGKKK